MFFKIIYNWNSHQGSKQSKYLMSILQDNKHIKTMTPPSHHACVQPSAGSVQQAGNLDLQLLSVSMVQVLWGASCGGEHRAEPRHQQQPQQEPRGQARCEPPRASQTLPRNQPPGAAQHGAPSPCESTLNCVRTVGDSKHCIFGDF